jgi:hypothetical protein
MKKVDIKIAVALRRVYIALLFLAAFSAPAFAQEQTVFMATPDQLRDGFAIVVGDKPGYVQYGGAVEIGTTIMTPATGLDELVNVTVVPPGKISEQTVVLPILIEDKTLARGVTLSLVTPEGKSTQLVIPPKRVFLSIPFTIPVTEQIDPDFGHSNRNLIVQVVPKITKKAQVNIDNTAAEGMVADIKYEGVAYLKLKDLLNRTNRRDMDGTFFIGKQEDYRWHIIAENLFEKYDKRNIGVMKNQRLNSELKSQWRVDHLNNTHDTLFGLNTEYDKGKTSVLFGNIDRRVKNQVHSEIGYGDERLRFKTRFEGIEILNPASHSAVAVKVDRYGYQLQCGGGNGNTSYGGRFGNLKVQDFEDEGEIDDYFNFDFSYSRVLGSQTRSWNPNALSLSGDTTLRFWGRGSATWLRGELNYNINYKTDYLTLIRYNNDFARITGRPNEPLWESMFISFMRNRNYFKRKDKLAHYGLESVHIDLDYTREGKGLPFRRKTRIGVSRFMKVFRYDLPLDIYVESVKFNVYRPGVGISIRRYL